MHKKYNTKKDRSFGVFLIIMSFIVLAASYGPVIFIPISDFSSILVLSVLVIFFLIIIVNIWFNTNYQIANNLLIVKMGLFKWKIKILDIKLIRLNQNTFAGTWKATLSWKCIEIKYKKYKSIFISPLNQDEFLNVLLNINQKITIKEK